MTPWSMRKTIEIRKKEGKKIVARVILIFAIVSVHNNILEYK